jgi:hypothetical protein
MDNTTPRKKLKKTPQKPPKAKRVKIETSEDGSEEPLDRRAEEALMTILLPLPKEETTKPPKAERKEWSINRFDIHSVLRMPTDERTIYHNELVGKWNAQQMYNHRFYMAGYNPDPLDVGLGHSVGYFAILRGDGSILYPEQYTPILDADKRQVGPSDLLKALNKLGKDRRFHKAPICSEDVPSVNIHDTVMLRCDEATSCRQLCGGSTQQVDLALSPLARFHAFTFGSVYKNAMSVLGRILNGDPRARVVFGSLELFTKNHPSAGVHYPFGRLDRTRLDEFLKKE